jgi:hypothetical protein
MSVFVGVVEDNSSDPLKMGRLKVRVVGVHTEIRKGEEDGKGLATADLPWCSPLGNESIDGQSDIKIPAQGSVVLVVFLDPDQQVPVYLGTIPKVADILPDFNVGFSDPAKQHPNADYKGESPLSRQARNDNPKQKNSPKSNSLFSEPGNPYAAKYPYNHVVETASGHVIEIDDTPGAERINMWHKSGTFFEMHPDGKIVTRVEGTNTTVVIADNNISIDGNHNLFVAGSQNINVGGNAVMNVGGNAVMNVGGSVEINSDGTVNITGASSVNIDGGSGGLQGVVTGSHICHFTGKPHGSISSTVKASK